VYEHHLAQTVHSRSPTGTAASQSGWLPQNFSQYWNQLQTVHSVMHKYMAAILKVLEAKEDKDYLLSMRSTYLNACFDSTILLELGGNTSRS
jgi:hypothetical protein